MKKILVTFLCTVVFFSSVYATSTIQAYLSDDITIKLNGTRLALSDANGNPVYPIIYNGTTYLPVRAVAENLDLEVSWDPTTKTVGLDEKGPVAQKEYGPNEYWEVKGLWKLKINSAKITTKRNEFSSKEPKEVVVINYTYENLGYSQYGGLTIEPNAVMDASRNVSDTYPVVLDNKPKTTPVNGIANNVEVAYGLSTEKNDFITISFSEYGENLDRHEATFKIPITK